MIDATTSVVARGTKRGGSKSAVLTAPVDPDAPMDADLDLLCFGVYGTADDLLPEPRRNAPQALRRGSPHLAPIRRRIESVFFTLNYQLGRPSRAIAATPPNRVASTV
jgi:hypothetical protein